MKIVVFGASGGTGRKTIEALEARGHEVTAFVRRPDSLTAAEGLRLVQGDVMNPDDVERAVRDQDAVVVALGIRENPLLVRLRGAANTNTRVRSTGTAHIVAAMQRQGVKKLVVQSTYGVGETLGRPSLKYRLLFSLLLKPQIEDTALQEQIVRQSGLDWVLVQPVSLTDLEAPEELLASTAGEARSMNVSRTSVAGFLARAVEEERFVEKSVALSA